jgi:oligopeptidase B
LIRGTASSPNSDYYIYGVDTTGDRRSTAYIKQLSNGKSMPETISNTTGSYAWNNDNKSFYYVLYDNTVRASRVMRHILGTSPSADKEIYSEKDSTYSVGLSKTLSGRYIFINSRSTNTTEASYLDANNPNASPVLIQSRIQGLEYAPDYLEGNVFHIYTNKNAKNFKLVSAPINSPGMENWNDIIPASDKAYLENTEIVKNYIIAQTKYPHKSFFRYNHLNTICLSASNRTKIKINTVKVSREEPP